MNLVYLTSKRYPSTTADHFFVRYMAEAFTSILDKNFSLLISGNVAEELKGVNTESVKAPRRLRFIFYFVWIPFFTIKKGYNSRETVYFSNDPILLSTLIFWKKLLKLQYKIGSDWHQLFKDWRDRFIAQNSDFLISTSQNLKNLIISVSGIKEDKILVAYGGVDLNMFEIGSEKIKDIRNSLGLSETDFLVGYVGFYKTMGMDKGLDTMLSSLPLIQDKKVKMVFIGGKDDEIKSYKEKSEAMNLGDRAVFVPVIPNMLVPVYECAMDLLVIPYPDKPHFRDYGFPMKVYEYMASNRPIIYSNLPIMAEVMSNCAVAFNSGDSRDLALKIIHLKDNSVVGENLTKKAKQKVENFTWHQRASNIVMFLERN